MVVTTGTDMSRQAYKMAALSSGKVLCTWTTSGLCSRSVAVRAPRASRLQITRAGTAARLAAGHCSISSLCRSNGMTSCPRSRRAWPSWSTTLFSPLGAAER